MKATVLKLLNIVLTPFVVLLSPVFYLAARTGIGIDFCRKLGFQPILVNYYQPVPDYESVPNEYFRKPQSFPGFRIDPTTIDDSLQQLSVYSEECEWPSDPNPQGGYHTNNNSFGYSSAAILHAMIRANDTRKVLEIGGGYSSLVSLAALQRNRPEGDSDFRCIEPYPSRMLEQAVALYADSAELISAKAEDVSLEVYSELKENEILFIDSSHVSKLASDVNFLYLQVLPRLKPGVIVHIHDIYMPYEYPSVHFRGRSKLYWNEQYLLQAFLTDNKKFEVILPGYHAQVDRQETFATAFPKYVPADHRPTTSFWMRKVA